MCGRFAFYSPREAVQDAFGVDLGIDPEPRFNIAPSQMVIALTAEEDGKLLAAPFKWGLVPFWAKEASIGNRLINARSETVPEKPSYRQAFKRRRCLILATGFYEWRAADGGKIPHFISLDGQPPFAMAGLWEVWDKGDEPLRTCTIITVPAAEQLLHVHHRMPLILTGQRAARWVAQATDAATLTGLMQRRSADDLVEWPVSRVVNNPANQGPELIEPAV